MRQKWILCIELSRGRGGSVYVSVSTSDCVLSIKHELETLTGIPTLSQTLYHAATQLSDSTPLHEFCHTAPVPTLSLHVPIRGGASRYPTNEPLEFVELNQIQFLQELSLNEELGHCGVKKGVNIVIRCGNMYCGLGATNSDVILQKENYAEHLGYCSVRTELLNMHCPQCGSKIPSLESFVFVDCVVLVEWRMKDGDEDRKELRAQGDTYQILRLTSVDVLYEYIDFRVRLN